jgi:hypothetical protein
MSLLIILWIFGSFFGIQALLPPPPPVNKSCVRPWDDGYKYNDINPIAENKWIIKIVAGILDVAQALLTTAKCIFWRLVYSTLAFLAELIKIALKVKTLFYSFETLLNLY